MHELEINVEHCRARQQRLLAEMRTKDLDLAIVFKPEHMQWLAGPRFPWLLDAAALVSIDGRAALVAPRREPVAAVEDVQTYEASRCSTMRNDQRQACAEALAKYLEGRPKPRRIGVEFSTFGPYLADLLQAELTDIEPDLYRLRRFKHPDELARIKKAIAGKIGRAHV